MRVVQRICLTPPAVRKGLNSHQSHGACSRHGGGREQCEGAQRNGTSHSPIGPPNYRANKDAVYSLWTKEPYASRLLLQRRKVQCLWENRTHFHGLSTARICMAMYCQETGGCRGVAQYSHVCALSAVFVCVRSYLAHSPSSSEDSANKRQKVSQPKLTRFYLLSAAGGALHHSVFTPSRKPPHNIPGYAPGLQRSEGIRHATRA